MKVFISWSGEKSKAIAEILVQWFPKVIPPIDLYYTPDDLNLGSRWASEISKELEESNVGIICLTKENLESTWIMFEAGALSKKMEKSKVCPILFGVESSDVKGPLTMFQSAKFNRNEIMRLVKIINSELGKNAIKKDLLEHFFEREWPFLQNSVIKEIKTEKEIKDFTKRSDRDLLEEILELTRALVRKNSEEPIRWSDDESRLVFSLQKSVKSKKFSFEYAHDKGVFSVLCHLDGKNFVVPFDVLEKAVFKLDTIQFSDDEKEIIEKMKVRLYQINHEIEQRIVSPPFPQ